MSQSENYTGATSAEGQQTQNSEPQAKVKWTLVGPGLVAAATGVGAADLVATMIAGQRYGYALLWAVIVGTIMKIVLVEGVGRYSLATGNTMFHGWRELGRWTSWYFAPYIVIWGLVYGAAAMSGTGLALSALFPGTNLTMWAILTGVLCFALTWLGQYQLFEKLAAVLVGIMFVTVVGIAAITAPNLPEILRGLVPTIPDGSFVYVLSIAGGVGGTITLAAYGYWLREKKWFTPKWMKVMRMDNSVAYAVTGIFVLATLVLGAELLYSANVAVSDNDQGLVDMADVLEARYGTYISKWFIVGFFSAAFSSCLGVWNGVSLMFADYVGHLKNLPQGHPSTSTGGKYYRAYLIWLTFPPMLLLLLGKPTGLIIGYGVLGAFFMPFLGLTLLVLLNTKHTPKEWRNGWFINTLMGIISAAFVYLCVSQVAGLF